MKRSLFVELMAAREAKRPVAMVTDLSSGRQALVGAGVAVEALGDLALSKERLAEIRSAILRDRSARLEDSSLFVHVFNPPLRMIVVGAVHIAQSLVPMARIAGFEVLVIDPRRAWATAERFPGLGVLTDWPDDAMKRLKPDHRTAVVTLTHDPKLDDPALAEALRSHAFYIGSLGSRKTHAKRLERLAELGFGAAETARIHGPIGLDIGARSPAEIAVSILAEITQTRHRSPEPGAQEAAA